VCSVLSITEQAGLFSSLSVWGKLSLILGSWNLGVLVYAFDAAGAFGLPSQTDHLRMRASDPMARFRQRQVELSEQR